MFDQNCICHNLIDHKCKNSGCGTAIQAKRVNRLFEVHSFSMASANNETQLKVRRFIRQQNIKNSNKTLTTNY